VFVQGILWTIGKLVLIWILYIVKDYTILGLLFVHMVLEQNKNLSVSCCRNHTYFFGDGLVICFFLVTPEHQKV
jgi:hypothetical protein